MPIWKHPSIVLIVFLLITESVLAEYRVFTLHIINRTAQKTRQIETTLDPTQFTTIYPLIANEEISYIETWRCKGRTDFFKSHCDNPRLLPQQNDRSISSQLDQQPVVVPSQSPELTK